MTNEKKPEPDTPALDAALAMHKRIGEYDLGTLSANERAILVLGNEVRRLTTIVRSHPETRREYDRRGR